MFVVIWLISLVLSGFLVDSARGKLVRQEKQVAGMRAVGFPVERIGWLALAELAGAVGLLAGLAWRPLGMAAAAGLVAYFVGAMIFLLRARLSVVPVWLSATAFLTASVTLLVLGSVAA